MEENKMDKHIIETYREAPKAKPKASNPFLKGLKPALLMLVLVVLGSTTVFGQIVVDATSSGFVNTNVTSITVSHTTGSNNNRLMLVGISYREGGSIASVTYNDDPLELVGSQITSTNAKTYIFRMINPPTGTANLVVTLTGGDFDKGGIVGVMTFSGVDQNTPLNTYVSSVGNSTNPTLSNITTATNELVFNVVSLRNTNLTGVGTGQTLTWNVASGDEIRGGGSTKPGSGATTAMSWTSASGDWSMSAVSIKPVAVADLSVDLSVSEFGPFRGEEIVYTITATNNGPETAPNVVVNLDLPDGFIYVDHTKTQGVCSVGAGLWDVGSLASGATATATITMVVGTSTDYTATASISGDVIDNTSSNNTDSVNINICAAGGTAPLFNQ